MLTLIHKHTQIYIHTYMYIYIEYIVLAYIEHRMFTRELQRIRKETANELTFIIRTKVLKN